MVKKQGEYRIALGKAAAEWRASDGVQQGRGRRKGKANSSKRERRGEEPIPLPPKRACFGVWGRMQSTLIFAAAPSFLPLARHIDVLNCPPCVRPSHHSSSPPLQPPDRPHAAPAAHPRAHDRAVITRPDFDIRSTSSVCKPVHPLRISSYVLD